MRNNSIVFCLNNLVVTMVRIFLLTTFIMPFVLCQSTATTTMHNNNNSNDNNNKDYYRTTRTLQQEDDNNLLYDPCSLCQGVPILFDKRVPNVDGSNYQPTCNEVDLYYRYNFTTTAEDYMGTPYQTGISASCKSDYGYNSYFDVCCQPSIPKCKFFYCVQCSVRSTVQNTYLCCVG